MKADYSPMVQQVARHAVSIGILAFVLALQAARRVVRRTQRAALVRKWSRGLAAAYRHNAALPPKHDFAPGRVPDAADQLRP